MALGCAFIFVVILMLWRRHARKRRAKATALFATAKRLDRPLGWRGRLVRFGERLFGHRTRTAPVPVQSAGGEQYRMEKLRAAEDARHSRDMDKLLHAYEYSRAGSSRGPSPLPSLRDYDRELAAGRQRASDAALADGESLYSRVTGLPRAGPQPRQPIRSANARDLLPSRFSDTTASQSWVSPEPSPPPVPVGTLVETERPPTPAQEYARMVTMTGQQEPRGAYWVEPAQPVQPTATGNSRNPFLR